MDRDLQHNNNQPPHTLFLSHDCRYCKLFLKELTKHNMIDSFNVVDVIKTPVDISKVKVVPTIVVNHQRVMSGREAFAWLENEKKGAVLGVVNYDVKNGFGGASSAFTYIEGDSAENVMSSAFSDIPVEERTVADTTMPKSDASVDSELQDKIEEMKKERGMVN
jgi:glutaredoxin